MKSTGIVRKIDELGRIVLPIELRRNLNIDIKNALEFCVEGNSIILMKDEPKCVFCGCTKDLNEYARKKICSECAKKIKEFSQCL